MSKNTWVTLTSAGSKDSTNSVCSHDPVRQQSMPTVFQYKEHSGNCIVINKGLFISPILQKLDKNTQKKGRLGCVRKTKYCEQKKSIPSLDYDVSNYLMIMQNLEVTAMLPSRDNLGFASTKRNIAKQENLRGKKNPQQVSIRSQQGDGSVSQATS